MPNKTMGYYWRTIKLKANAFAYAGMEKLGFLDNYLKKQSAHFIRLHIRDFNESVASGQSAFHPFFYTYCHFGHPDELGRNLKFSENGVAWGRSDQHQIEYINPFFSAYYALVCFNHYQKTASPDSLDKFKTQAVFLSDYGKNENGCFHFFYDFLYEKYSIEPPWCSALMQAAALSIFIRASDVFKDETYARLADKVYRSLYVPIGKTGGVLRTLDDGCIWMEERPAPFPDLTLNGFVYCLVSVYEYYHWKGKPGKVEEQLQNLVRTFFIYLPIFVRGKWTRYNCHSMKFHNIEYQGFMTCLFLHLWKLSGKKAFGELAINYNNNTDWGAFYEFYGLKNESTSRVEKYFSEKQFTS